MKLVDFAYLLNLNFILMSAAIKVFTSLVIMFSSQLLHSQECEDIVVTDKFTKDKGAVFYLEKVGGLTTTVTFDQRASYPSLIMIRLDAGNFRGDNSRSAKYFTKKVGVMMYFIFEDGTTKYISQDQSIAFGTSISINKTDEIVTFLRNKRITDIRVIINEIDIKIDYVLPERSKNYFQKLLTCMNW